MYQIEADNNSIQNIIKILEKIKMIQCCNQIKYLYVIMNKDKKHNINNMYYHLYVWQHDHVQLVDKREQKRKAGQKRKIQKKHKEQ